MEIFGHESSDNRSTLQARIESGNEMRVSKTQLKHEGFYVETLNLGKSQEGGETSLYFSSYRKCSDLAGVYRVKIFRV